MKIRPKIPMLLGGNNIWYNGILDYDPTRYVHAYDTSRLVNPLNFGEAWASRTNGLGRGRYVPNPSFSRDLVRNIELNNNYYKNFTDALFNTDGTLSDVGKAYARLSDNLLPENSLARVYNGDLMRNNWTTTNNDTYGRPGRSFNNVKDYLYYERNDNLPGGRHNVFLDKGKRYFYVDNEGKYHWVSPEDASKYLISEKPTKYGWGDDGVYWEDYELTGLKSPNDPPSSDLQIINGGNPLSNVGGQVTITGNRNSLVPTGHNDKYGFDWNKIKEGARNILTNPDLWATGRLIGNLKNNDRVYDEQLKGITPDLRLTYYTHRQVVGDEATKQAYYRRAAAGQTKAAQPFTSDADRQMAYMQEARRVGDELRAQGDLADNQEIRRTSDESNLHLWTNTQRATEVANANIASMNQANALRHNLLAQKHSAQWSSIDNFLKEIEYRKRLKLAEEQALNDQIYTLTRAGEIENDKELLDLKSQFEAASKKPENQKDSFGLKVINYDAKEIKDLINRIKGRLILLLIETLKNRPKYNSFSLNYKSGGKVTHKKKDDLLYKSTRDIVEHFRKMSKISSDALNRRKPKIEKLTSHPKTKKYQLGGVAPFTVYTPVSMGGETTRTSQYDSSTSSKASSKDNEGKETLDLMKSLFEKMLGKGLPVDVNAIYSQMNNLFSQYKAFGNELDTNDIALLYLQSMQSLNNAMYSKELYDKAKAYATQNDSLNEFAVNALGHFVVLDTETGKLSTEKSWKDVLESGKNPITNLQLLNLRAYNPDLVSQAGDSVIENVINNGMGINKIGAQIKALAGNIGSYEGKIEGLTQVESNQVKLGLLLLANAPDGYYKHTVEDKNLQTQMKAAISYITNMLSPSQRAILDAHGGADKLIPLFLASQENITHNVSFSPLTGKAAKDSSESKGGGLEMNNALKLLTGAGEGHLETFGIGNNNVFLAIGRQSTIADTSDSEKPFGADFSYNKIYESGIGRILDLDNASFGDVPINKAMKDSIIVDNSRIVSVDLPYTTTRDGRIIPDFKLLSRILEADEEILRQNLNPNKESDINKINQIYADKKLPIKYNSTNQLSGNYRKFAVILATAVEDVFLDKNGLETNATLTLVTDDNEKDKYVRLMSEITKDKKYSLNKPGMFSWGDKDIYKGSIFIPITGDILDASLAGGGSKVKTGMSDDYDTMRKAWQVRNYLEVPQVNFGN